jgi:hypothetical protein
MSIAGSREYCAVVNVGGNMISNDGRRGPACHVERQVFAHWVDQHDGLPRDRFAERRNGSLLDEQDAPVMRACHSGDFLLESQRAC